VSPVPHTTAEPCGVTRLAPSPTGALHLGNARTFLLNWGIARKMGWRIVLRIEDLDGLRIKPGAAAQIIQTLRWLGMDWDEGPYVQSDDLSAYIDAMRALGRAGLAFPSRLTRSDLLRYAEGRHEERAQVPADEEAGEGASAPQAGARETRFPPELRPPPGPYEFDPNFDGVWRFRTPEGPAGTVEFVDVFAGPQRICAASSVGDFILWTRLHTPAYQLGVVVDDHRQGVNRIIRGDDLLDSAARQRLLARALGLTPEPVYAHLPLVVGPDGRRLAKRHGDTRIESYRERGVRPEAIVGLVMWWSGLIDERRPMSVAALVDRIDPDDGAWGLGRMKRSPVVFAQEDERWLLEYSNA
jgi:glutamyl-tRNA synthetase